MKRVLTASPATLPFAANAADAISGRGAANELAGDYYVPDFRRVYARHYLLGIKTRTFSWRFTAGGNITGFQNGLAIAGDYMSAASFWGSPRWCLPPAMTA